MNALFARFWASVEVLGDDDCWPWLGAKTGSGGYGHMYVNGAMIRAHRLAHILTKGDIPAGLVILHTCDNPVCCNPRHLSAGTKAENTADMLQKGRAAVGGKNGRATITDDTAREILRRASSGEPRAAIADSLGVSLEIVRNIATRRKWKHVS